MKVFGTHYRTIWYESGVKIIDQSPITGLPHNFRILSLNSSDDAARAIKDMQVRGAGLIGATAGYGMYLGVQETIRAHTKDFEEYMTRVCKSLISTRPTAVNLSNAVNRQKTEINKKTTLKEKLVASFETAETIANEDSQMCKLIGEYGFPIINDIYSKKGERVNVLTHCNAGWLAFVDHGSALSPVYEAHNQGIPVHVWVDMTGPWNQGGRLTAWELEQEGIPYTVIADNTGGHLMQKGLVDMVIVGADRVTRKGHVANKIGTYLKALAAKDNDVPFYVAFPETTIDWNIDTGDQIPIEERGGEEVKFAQGLFEKTKTVEKVLLTPEASHAANYGFDVTRPELITGFITEDGIIRPDKLDLLNPNHLKNRTRSDQ